jgi:L-threonylcarbamoyladenylate synthase
MSCDVGTDIERAAQLIRNGGLVAIPTETVYGLGADAFNPVAVARIFEVKRRPRFDPLIVHIAAGSRLKELAAHVPPPAQRLAARFWPGPLTLVLPKRDAVPDLVTAGLPTVAVRVPAHPVALELLQRAGCPIAAPSANPFGFVSPTLPQHVAEQLGEEVDYILDGGPCAVGIESTVIEFGSGQPRILRHGGLPVEDIEAVIGRVEQSVPAGTTTGPVPAPGMLSRHCAPHTPLIIGGLGERLPQPGAWGLLTLQASEDPSRFAAIEVLSPRGDLREAAARFFAALRRLDALGLAGIVATPFPETGLGRALNDRLRRAAARS